MRGVYVGEGGGSKGVPPRPRCGVGGASAWNLMEREGEGEGGRSSSSSSSASEGDQVRRAEDSDPPTVGTEWRLAGDAPTFGCRAKTLPPSLLSLLPLLLLQLRTAPRCVQGARASLFSRDRGECGRGGARCG